MSGASLCHQFTSSADPRRVYISSEGDNNDVSTEEFTKLYDNIQRTVMMWHALSRIYTLAYPISNY